ncbi:LysR family transcriptional regulator [Opitutaceae bacterium TAV4]|nr:LysR family transcriptional regulator [Opitutaceae bacterium TAV4]RRK00985.1 LysR family transcriptional regulator [Opitutaceae bacterium TAV3]
MELRHLRYFLAVAEELNFRRAADRLRISHPALSKQIRDLEQELGVRLLERTTVSVWLTKAGQQFRKDSLKILSSVDLAVAALLDEAEEPRQLMVGTAGPFWESVLPDVLKRFRKNNSQVKFHILDKHPRDQIDALQRGEIQIAFVSKREAIPRANFDQTLMLRSPFGVVLGRDHPLARQRKVRWDDIRQETFLFLGSGRGSPHLQDIRKLLPRKGLSRQQLKNVDSINALVPLIASGQGISLLPKAFVTARQRQVCYRPLDDARTQLQFQLWAVWRTGDRSKLLKDFIGELRSRGS